MTNIPGYSLEGRKISAAVFIPLSVLFLVLSVVYGGPKDGIVPAMMLGVSLLLFTRFWWIVYPTIFLVLGSLILWNGVSRTDWLAMGVGIFILLMGSMSGFEKLRKPQER